MHILRIGFLKSKFNQINVCISKQLFVRVPKYYNNIIKLFILVQIVHLLFVFPFLSDICKFVIMYSVSYRIKE